MAQELAAFLPALLTIAAIVLGVARNNKRIDHLDTRIGDLKELVKAEIRAEGARLELALGGRLDRIEQRLDRIEQPAGHAGPARRPS